MKHFLNVYIFLFILIGAGCTEKPVPLSTQPQNSQLHIDAKKVEVDSNEYLYEFLRMVVKDQLLNYSYGLTLKVENTLSHDDDDTYLLRFIKATPKKITYYPMSLNRKDTLLADTSIIQLKTEPFVFTTESFLIFNPTACLTKRDINQMLAEKRRLQSFKWNNERLGFNLANENNWYVFSLPYFSTNKKIALISIRSLCKPFLCGDGYVLLYKFENGKWTSTKVDYWIH